MSVREARAQFAHTLSVAENGDRVTITKNGKSIAKIGPSSRPVNTFSWERLEAWRIEQGLDKLPPDPRSEEEWFADFNDPVFPKAMLDSEIEPRES